MKLYKTVPFSLVVPFTTVPFTLTVTVPLLSVVNKILTTCPTGTVAIGLITRKGSILPTVNVVSLDTALK